MNNKRQDKKCFYSKLSQTNWIPACAGMTAFCAGMTAFCAGMTNYLLFIVIPAKAGIQSL